MPELHLQNESLHLSAGFTYTRLASLGWPFFLAKEEEVNFHYHFHYQKFNHYHFHYQKFFDFGNEKKRANLL